MPDYKWPNLRRNVFLNVHQYYQERQQLVAEVQQKVDRLKREQKKRDELAAKIKVSFQSLMNAGGETPPIFRRWRASSWWVGGASLTTPMSSRGSWTSSNRKWLVRRWADHVTVM